MSKEFSDFDKEEGKTYFNQEIVPPKKRHYFLLIVWSIDRKSTRLNSIHLKLYRMPSFA